MLYVSKIAVFHKLLNVEMDETDYEVTFSFAAPENFKGQYSLCERYF